MSEEEREILTECAKRMREIAARPTPRDRWGKRELAELRTYGPRYLPGEWFGDGEAVPEKFRSRYLRAIWRLAGSGLLEAATAGGRLANIKLTAEGEAAVAALELPDAATGTIAPADAPGAG